MNDHDNSPDTWTTTARDSGTTLQLDTDTHLDGATTAGRRSRIGRRARNWLLTVHIVVSVGLLGDSAGFLAVAIRHGASDDPVFRENARDLLSMFALSFGIPLSFLALLSGLALGIGTRWGVFRYPWVIAKLALIVTVIAVGAIVLRPVLFDADTANDSALIAGATWDVAALTAATGLSVFKPGRSRPSSTR
jgi:hypothetical protein